MNLENYIRDVPDFPKPGVVFKDITPLLRSPEAFAEAVKQLCDHFRSQNVQQVVAAEARGFIFGTAVAQQLGAGFVPVRKPGKLPWKTISKTYSLEYGEDALCVHEDAIRPGERVLLVDDVLATGGTMRACVELAEDLKGKVLGCAFLAELDFLHGRSNLPGRNVFSLIHYA